MTCVFIDLLFLYICKKTEIRDLSVYRQDFFYMFVETEIQDLWIYRPDLFYMFVFCIFSWFVSLDLVWCCVMNLPFFILLFLFILLFIHLFTCLFIYNCLKFSRSFNINHEEITIESFPVTWALLRGKYHGFPPAHD